MSDIDARQIEHMKGVFEAQRRAFAAAPPRSIAERQADLRKLEDLARSNVDAFSEAVADDFSCRAAAETKVGEMAMIVKGAKHARTHVRAWSQSKPVSVDMNMAPGKAYVRMEPKGVIGIVSPWNYPVQLALLPLAAALAAGCRAIIKPSELTPRTSELMRRLLSEAYDETHVTVVLGGPAVGEAFSKLPLDHLFYTGSTQVGRLVAMAAASNLTPVTLELGGKSPVIMTAGYPIKDAAATLAWGKFYNAGQTCVAPDYVLAPRAEARALGAAIIAAAAEQYGVSESNRDYTAIVSDRHFTRLTGLLADALQGGGEALSVPHDKAAAEAARKIAPTVVFEPPLDCGLMREEIFGPILPIIPYDTLEDAIAFVRAREHPLALYVYSSDKTQARRVLEATLSGGAAVNVPMLHLGIEELPFGGVGKSGYGAYHGERGFREFSHERAVFEAPRWHPSRLLAPPYGKLFKTISDHVMRG